MAGREERCSEGKLDWTVGVECGSENAITCHRTSSVALILFIVTPLLAMLSSDYPTFIQLCYELDSHLGHSFTGHMQYLSSDLS